MGKRYSNTPAIDVSDKSVLVIGLGKSGVSTALAFAGYGARVKANDVRADPATPETLEALRVAGVDLVLGGQLDELPDGTDIVLPSPGVPSGHPLLVEAAECGIPVWGELESAWRLFPHRNTIAITGTNGKTTVTELTAHLINAAGSSAVTGGNIGTPMIDVLGNVSQDVWVVAEVSSFQVAQAPTFEPLASAFLNFDVDHLDWHSDMDEYFEAKAALVRQTRPEGICVLPFHDERIRELAGQARARAVFFGSGIDASDSKGAEVISVSGATASATPTSADGSGEAPSAKDDTLCVSTMRDGTIQRSEVALSSLIGTHNQENAAAAIGLVSITGIDISTLSRGLAGYMPGEHRLQRVGEFAGVEYVDDSKATNPLAVRAAVESISRPLILLVGGRNKGYDLAELSKWASSRVKALVCFGESGPEFASASEAPRTHSARSMKEAVALAVGDGAPGDVVLLSPGCASFDEFNGYGQRGDAFQEEVRLLAGTAAR